MKTSILTFALGLVLSANVFAADDLESASTASINTTNRVSVYNLVYASAKTGLVTVSIKNQDGQVVLQEQIFNDKKGFIRPYNFSTMPEGSYTLEVKDAAGKSELSLAYSNVAVNAVRKAEIKALESNKYQLRLVGNTADAVEVSIYDQFGSTIHSESLSQKGSFTRIYDLSKLKNAKGAIEVRANGKVVNRVEL
ncbi:hypothetical protein QNI19_33810 [Cytophagaceae bacterium DM2B3-1]|uniref:Por secretion system C-terminal sorting domain-containing protein n=1 Tax=Xanthocytophaga flava TaxID=3048013 RepID=A0AAE3QU88_9BACT|nr:hypothetical protein [Xanthocytophaga flavus]MDJ1472617.1 hypothetical protein [Xanthocytophaga flavus]MDJ1485076.1 hypothetical protein [Xanthocytophaga flavus]MDJ1497967.1 hypothetical protein [Xanthocytophaga flavus]